MAEIISLAGAWLAGIGEEEAEVRLPGTLDENGIGGPDDPLHQWKVDEVRRIGFWKKGDPIVTRLTRKRVWEGQAAFRRTLEWQVPEGRRLFLEAERARQLRLLVNGREVSPIRPGTLSAPAVFEATGRMTGRDEICFLSDNSYPGWPREAIVYSSAASDETQTNWNGLLGWIRLRTEQRTFIEGIRVYPRGNRLDIRIDLDSDAGWEGTLRIRSDAMTEETLLPVRVPKGRTELRTEAEIREDAARWDLEEGNLHRIAVSAPELETREAVFGIRDFRAEGGRLRLNGRPVFLRSEANCAVFPETGYPPMEKEAWKEILGRYRAYGVNCMRFHSHCPPEAAFAAADEMGLLMQPELSHWDPEHAFGSEEAREYYRAELQEIQRTLANHPSFVMLTFGNELQADKAGHAFMDGLLREARERDGTRLYANGSNPHYGQLGTDPESDFYASMRYFDREMRGTCDGMSGWLNGEAPNSCHDYEETVREIRKTSMQPVFSFEVGQYEVLPDFGEIDRYRGVTRPDNLCHIRRKVREKGLEEIWPRMVEATGESSLMCYRAEVEAALRTEGYSGISLLGLQDFPGQGTALVGMMNAHLEPKPYGFARPERFAAFFRDALPLVLLPKFTWHAGEKLEARVKLANYGKYEMRGEPVWTLGGPGFEKRGRLPAAQVPPGGLTDLGWIRTELDGPEKPVKLTLTAELDGCRNSYPIWVYPRITPAAGTGIHECRRLDARAEGVLRAGGTVFLAPDSTEEAMPHSVQAQFSPDFWSVCTFPQQTGCMGLLLNAEHPLFRRFPTESWGNWQWHAMANRRALLLPERIRTIAAEMDSYAFLRPMAMLFECRCGGGRLMVSSMGLHQLRGKPEADALLQAIYGYLGSEAFRPAQELSPEWIRGLFEK